jgi:2-polyprenyl-3-methyl-5-hydroxy-6-metoxy-1,4-benzoquinol methylase
MQSSDSGSAESPAKYTWVDVPACPVCGCEESTPFHKYVVDNRHYFVRCSGCDLLYVAPRPVYDRQFIEDMYEGEDDGVKGYEKVADFREHALTYYHSMDLLSQAEEFLPGKGSFLDVGCNRGYLVFAANERGWAASGVDISKRAVDFCKSKGIDVHCEDITAAPASRQYDLVACCHVIEHVPDPVVFLNALKDRMKDKGMLVIEIPNILGLDLRLKRWLEQAGLKKTRIHSPHHLYEFTYTAFRNLAEKCGLEIIACYTYSRHRRKPGLIKRLYNWLLKYVHTGNKFRMFLRKKQG